MHRAELLLRKAEIARQKAEAAQRRADKAAEQARTAELTQEILDQGILNKVRAGARDRAAIRNARETIAMRYNANSCLGKIDIKSFTILVERLNIQCLRRLDRYVPDALLKETREIPLPSPFWLDYHQKIKDFDCDTSKLYFMGV